MKHLIPRLPVLDWTTFTGAHLSDTPCFLAHPGLQFTNSGRASILLALEILGISADDKVLIPTYHCPTMVAPIIARGAQAIFYPLDTVGAPRLEWIKNTNLQGVRAILVPHFFGLPQPLVHIRQWCDQAGIYLIEDCAHGLFGRSGDRPLGRWGDLAIASLTKFFPVLEGGCLVNNTVPSAMPQLQQPNVITQFRAGFDIVHTGVNYHRLKGLGTLVRGLTRFLYRFKNRHAAKEHAGNTLPLGGFTIDTTQSHRALTYASRWTTQHASRARIVARRRENYIFFTQALSGLSGIKPLHPDLPDHCAPYVFPLWVDQPDPGYAALRQLGFPVSRWDRLWPMTATFEEDSGVQWSHHILQLACHQDLQPKELSQMVSTLKQVYIATQLAAVPPQGLTTGLNALWHDAPQST